jgi:hypothetical protein
MGQNIQNFYSAVIKRDFARRFQFRLGPNFAGTNLPENALIYVEAATLPGRSITNVPVPFMGLQFNVPGTAQYPDSAGWAVRFRCDQNYDIRRQLENAQFRVFDDQASTGNYFIPRRGSTVVLNLLGKEGAGGAGDSQVAPIRQYTLYGAYINNIGAMSYELGDAGAIQTIDATIAYQYWRVTKVTGDSNNSAFFGATQ